MEKKIIKLIILLGHEKLVELLISRGANINAKDFFERTPLLLAASEGHLKIVQILREKGATLESTDRDKAVKELTDENDNINKQDTKTDQELANVKGIVIRNTFTWLFESI